MGDLKLAEMLAARLADVVEHVRTVLIENAVLATNQRALNELPVTNSTVGYCVEASISNVIAILTVPERRNIMIRAVLEKLDKDCK